MKIGVIGTGYWGKKHVQEFLKLGMEVVVADVLKKNREFCKQNFKVEIHENYNDLLSNPLISSISICTPSETHKQIALDCLKHKKNILIEKPLAMTTKDVSQILDYAKITNNLVMTGHLFRFNSAIKKIKELIDKNQLGTIYHVELDWSDFYPLIGVNSLIGKDILFDQGIHPVDIVDFLFSSEPYDLHLINSGFRMDNSEHSILNFKFKKYSEIKNSLVSIKLSWVTPIRKREMIIVGSKQTIICDCSSQNIILIDNEKKESREIGIIRNDPLHDELDFFVKCIKTTNLLQPPYPTGEVAKKIINLLEKAKFC